MVGPRPCSVCKSALRAVIEAEALKSSPHKASLVYSLNSNTVRRHMRLHYAPEARQIISQAREIYLPPDVRPQVVQVADQSPITIPNAYQQLDDLRRKLFEIIDAPAMAEGEEWAVIQDKQYRLGAMRELRATIAATLKLWEAQRSLEDRYSGAKPLQASMIATFLQSNYPDVMLELVAYLKSQRVNV